ncbi:CsiV family protein [Endozoicomonas arenosclerae]|uniref:CsiV family protein n=1 Tax=Endozoicomonas arenosclerae TaxID=1633495 RepID=UPI001560BDA2|nr:CsiV family protein [Endozoicomonas arenosclerae]
MNKPLSGIQKSLTALLLSAVSMSILANTKTESTKKDDTRWYQADMIVFLNEQSMNGSEKWPAITPHSLPANSIKLKSYDPSGTHKESSSDLTSFLDQPDKKTSIDLERDAFVSLPYQSHLLQKEGNTLSRNGSYRILEQKAWLMPIKEGESTVPVRIRSYNTQSRMPSMLEGTITVSSSRFLHVNANFWYSELAWEGLANNMGSLSPSASSPEQKPMVDKELQLVTTPGGQPMRISRNFQLNESRRIRNSKQVQYLDSPVIGVLFKLTPYERPDKELLPEMTPDSEEKSPELGILPGIINQEG